VEEPADPLLPLAVAAAVLVPPSGLHAESSPAPPAAAASSRNARRPWSSAIASLPFDVRLDVSARE
jgi:hypothetical protein